MANHWHQSPTSALRSSTQLGFYVQFTPRLVHGKTNLNACVILNGNMATVKFHIVSWLTQLNWVGGCIINKCTIKTS